MGGGGGGRLSFRLKEEEEEKKKGDEEKKRKGGAWGWWWRSAIAPNHIKKYFFYSSVDVKGSVMHEMVLTKDHWQDQIHVKLCVSIPALLVCVCLNGAREERERERE